MNRCVAPLAVAVALLATQAAWAQALRPFPPNALRGDMVVLQPPMVSLNGQPARLAPGARIRGQDNLLALSGSLVDQRLVVHYTREPGGELLNVWILTPAEGARVPWPRTEEQAARWAFDVGAQTWSRP